uniref:Uncharacterized protein n=1 Tax=Ditylenchus dipsaci TaxID=166011 RepID=A0A915DL40_9BILA
MTEAVKLLDDNWDFTDFCKEYLLDSNKKFSVIGAVGATGSGKSTVLSMLAGNDTADFYREYVFRPSAREAVESSRFQTTKIYVYINKNRTIFLDCQAIGCASLFEEYIYRRQTLPVSSDAFELTSVQLLNFLVSACHTLLFCIDWFIDLASVRELLKTINIVVLHQRSKEADFQPVLVHERMNILEGIFENSIFNVCGGLNMASLGFRRYSQLKSNVNYVLLGS